MIVELANTESLRSLSRELFEKEIVDSHQTFQIFVRLNGQYNKFKAGRYLFAGKVSPQSIVEKMVKGEVFVPIALQIVIPEGFNIRQVADRLVSNKVGTRDSLRRTLLDQSFIKSLKIPGTSLEGFLFPATYSFTEVPTERDFIRKAVDTFWSRLPEQYEQKVNERGLSLYQAVVFASLIEMETKFDDERSLVSEVIWSRLKRGEPLGIDAAIIYGIDRYDGNIRSRDLKNAKNPYNLRIHKGLPPTPIGSVSTRSLEAVLNPSDLGYYYYVLKADGSGRHHFTKTIQEHNRLVHELTQSYRARGRY